MSRAPVTIAILAWNSWDTTRACLDSLRPTLGVRDQVVVVDNGSTDDTPAGLRRYPWVEVVTNAENRGFAGGCNDAAARARHDILIFLNNDTVLAHQWLDPLVAAFDDPTVGAAGPRSNFVSGPQVVPSAVYRTSSELRQFARSWSLEHRGRSDDAARLVGFCLAVRRDIFEQVGRFDEGYGIGGFEDDDLCQKVMKAGYRLVIRHDSFVHHEGHKTFDANGLDWFAEQQSNRDRFLSAHTGVELADPSVFISACLIVKDEEDRLRECLQSVTGVADQVVVYDTGSTDGTVQLARDLGAQVIEGYWDDDFSRARNAALEHCEGEWVIWLDADETLQVADPVAFRSLLSRTKGEIEAWSVRIQNLTGVGVGSEFTHHAARIFRRTRCEWAGRLHEQIAKRGDHGPIVQADLEDGGWIRHTGYLEDAMRSRNKAERNLRVAQAEVDHADGWDRGYSLTSLGRSLLLAGRPEEALARVTEALDHTDNTITRRLAVRAAIESSQALGRLDDALAWCARLRDEGADANTADAMEAGVRAGRGDWEDVLRLLAGVTPGRADADGFAPAPGLVAAQKAQALGALGRYGEAADALLAGLMEAGVLDTHLGSLVDYMCRAGRSLGELAAAIPADRTAMFLAQVLQLNPGAADAVLDACVGGAMDQVTLLATASRLAPRLPLERTLTWAARIRAAGFADSCPLLALASDHTDTPPVLRARAAAVAQAAFADPAAAALFEAACAASSPLELEAIRAEAGQLCPAFTGLVPASGLAVGAAGPAVGAGAGAGAGLRASVVIPCFNRRDLTVQCLESLAAHTDPGSCEVILVDNGSTDGTSDLSVEGDESFRLIRNDENRGFARACNQGASAAAADVVVFLNNDIVVTPDWLPNLLRAFAEDPQVGIIGARLLFPDGTLQHAGIDLVVKADGMLHGDHRYYRQPADHPAALVRTSVKAVTGAALAVRRAVLEEVGGFSEEYWNGNEDVDLCLAAAERGWRVLYEPAATLIHFESQSGPQRWTGYQRNVKVFNDRWGAKHRASQGALATSS